MLKLLLKNTSAVTPVNFPTQLYLLWKQNLSPFLLKKRTTSRWRRGKWRSFIFTKSSQFCELHLI